MNSSNKKVTALKQFLHLVIFSLFLSPIVNSLKPVQPIPNDYGRCKAQETLRPNQVLKISIFDDSLGNSTYMIKTRKNYIFVKKVLIFVNINTSGKFMFREVTTSPKNPRGSLQRTSKNGKSMPHKKVSLYAKDTLQLKDCLRLRIFSPRELMGHCHVVSFHCWQIVSRLVRTTQQKCDNDAFLPRLGLPFTLIRHKKKLFDTAPKTGRIWKRWFHVLVLVWTKNKGFFENHDVTINMWFPRATFPPTQS